MVQLINQASDYYINIHVLGVRNCSDFTFIFLFSFSIHQANMPKSIRHPHIVKLGFYCGGGGDYFPYFAIKHRFGVLIRTTSWNAHNLYGSNEYPQSMF